MSGAEDGRKHPRNTLNDLTGREWLRFTKTWLIVDSRRYHRNRATELHPARYPEELVGEFMRFFSRPGEWVLDPFAGSGATLVAAQEAGRRAVGIELSGRYATVAQERVAATGGAWVKQADARRVADPAFWRDDPPADLPFDGAGLPIFDFVMTSPPYWDMLRQSRGGVESTHKRRGKQGLDTAYSEAPEDLGNTSDYPQFLAALCGILADAGRLLRPERYLVVVAQNLRAPDGSITTLAWDIQRELGGTLRFQGERIWCQNSKRLGIWGYPRLFVPNYHHHYCLIFRREPTGLPAPAGG
jgi:DNA modification methylase